ncbi:MAG: hypothetical protein ACUVSH_11190, partial [Anaerolineae bacterium]
AQLLVDNGGLFDSWEPYAPYRTLTVHFGFPTAAALLSWATGLRSVQAVLLTGQLLNGLAVLTLYPLGMRIAGGRRWAGVGAVLAAGLLSPMPAYYVNWGRYAQLAGQAILPVALWLTWDAVESGRRGAAAILLAALALGGMSLCYYRMPLYYAPFVLIWLAIEGIICWKRDVRKWLGVAVRLTLIGVIGVAWIVPWWTRIARGQLATAVEAGMLQASSFQHVLSEYQVWRDIVFYVPLPLLIVSILGIGWGLFRREWQVVLPALWTLLLALWVAARLIRLPAANMMQNFAVLIALYMPVGLLSGYFIERVASALKRLSAGGCWGWRCIVAVVALWGAVQQTRIVQPQFIMVTRPDMRAMEWIREYVPATARFLVEGFRIYDGRSAVGADAGWWLPLLAGRENTMPPQYALLNEAPAEPLYSLQVVNLVAALESGPPTSPENLRQLCGWPISHVYIGQGQGQVGAGARQLFALAALDEDPAFEQVYHQDRVYIFALNPAVCGEVNR